VPFVVVGHAAEQIAAPYLNLRRSHPVSRLSTVKIRVTSAQMYAAGRTLTPLEHLRGYGGPDSGKAHIEKQNRRKLWRKETGPLRASASNQIHRGEAASGWYTPRPTPKRRRVRGPGPPASDEKSDDEKITALLRDLDELVKLGIFEPGPKPGVFRVTVDADQLAAALYAQVMKRGGPGPDPES
jgi:hypothetical protein